MSRFAGKISEKRSNIQDYIVIGDDYIAIKEGGSWEIVNNDGDMLTGEKYYSIKRVFNLYVVKYKDGWYILDKYFDREETKYISFADVKRAILKKTRF